ncbi:hypothetical protein VitviT2T_005845 [Vitis vinifera]|uniref:EamA domain-containing protein n=2 Tax=Vitis vinifera TaxID=29760 RepID=A0ABY9BU41_VITVI|nr:WAT1-related protein At1g68170-like [Vitis vinifera]WJZ86385.1 hypothetical protein VitviT2T_005845 [Vitis vinifera]
MGGKLSHVVESLMPATVMVLVQATISGINIFYKLAKNDGMNTMIMVAYRYIFAAAAMAPLALILEWNSRPRMTWMVFFQGFFCGLFGGSLGQNLFAESLALTSATYVSAIANLVPAMTFILAIIMRVEKLAIQTSGGKAKVSGVILSISGAMVLTFYNGIELKIWTTHINLLSDGGKVAASQHTSRNQGLGAIMAAASSLSAAIWLIIQARMSKVYPLYSGTFLMCACAGVQCAVYAMSRERDWSEWRLGWNIRLLTVIYTAVVGTGVMVSLMAWVSMVRGPIFVSSFFPLMPIMVAVASSLLLDEKLHLGSVIGAVLIIIGLYVVLWGKGKEMKKTAQLDGSKSFRGSGLGDVDLGTSSRDGNRLSPGAIVPTQIKLYCMRDADNNRIVCHVAGKMGGDEEIRESKPSKLFEREAETINVSTAPAKDDASDVSTTATTHHR